MGNTTQNMDQNNDHAAIRRAIARLEEMREEASVKAAREEEAARAILDKIDARCGLDEGTTSDLQDYALRVSGRVAASNALRHDLGTLDEMDRAWSSVRSAVESRARVFALIEAVYELRKELPMDPDLRGLFDFED